MENSHVTIQRNNQSAINIAFHTPITKVKHENIIENLIIQFVRLFDLDSDVNTVARQKKCKIIQHIIWTKIQSTLKMKCFRYKYLFVTTLKLKGGRWND